MVVPIANDDDVPARMREIRRQVNSIKAAIPAAFLARAVTAAFKICFANSVRTIALVRLFRSRLPSLVWPTSVACLIISLLCVGEAVCSEPRRVLLMHAFGHAFSPWSDVAASFRSNLTKKSRDPIEIYEVSLDTARASGPNDEKPFIDYIQALFAGTKPDLIVSIGGPAIFFAQRRRSELFPDTPMLLLAGDKRRIPPESLKDNDIAVLFDLDLAAFIQNVLHLRPETKEIAVAVGNSPVERYWIAELQSVLPQFAERVHISWFNELTFEQMLARAASMPPTSAILYSIVLQDAAGVPYSQDRALERFREVSNVPLFGVGDYQLGRGIMGGPLIQTDVTGAEGADAALRLFRGEAPRAISIPPIPLGVPDYDWRELQRWHIAEALLPPGSIIQFREQSLWQKYRWQVAGVLGLVLLQATMITWLLLERRRRLRAQADLEKRLLEVIHLNRTAMAGALSASVAHELNQPLAAIQANAEAASIYLKANPPDIERLERILEYIRRDDRRAADIISHLRGLLKKKDAAELQEFDLNDVVRDALHFVRPEALKRGVEVKASTAKGTLPVRGDPVHLQQVILNLAMNGMDAMQACARGRGEMSIHTARIRNTEAEVVVADSGTGVPSDKLNTIFDTFYTTKHHGTGLGLPIARTIVETYGGKIWAENRPEGGATFRFTVPVLTDRQT